VTWLDLIEARTDQLMLTHFVRLNPAEAHAVCGGPQLFWTDLRQSANKFCISSVLRQTHKYVQSSYQIADDSCLNILFGLEDALSILVIFQKDIRHQQSKLQSYFWFNGLYLGDSLIDLVLFRFVKQNWEGIFFSSKSWNPWLMLGRSGYQAWIQMNLFEVAPLLILSDLR